MTRNFLFLTLLVKLMGNTNSQYGGAGWHDLEPSLKAQILSGIPGDKIREFRGVSSQFNQTAPFALRQRYRDPRTPVKELEREIDLHTPSRPDIKFLSQEVSDAINTKDFQKFQHIFDIVYIHLDGFELGNPTNPWDNPVNNLLFQILPSGLYHIPINWLFWLEGRFNTNGIVSIIYEED